MAVPELAAMIDALAALGEKRAGTPAGAAAAGLVRDAFTRAGLTEVRLERFAFPLHTVDQAVFEAPGRPGFHVLEASGGGAAGGALVAVGGARETELAQIDPRGRIALNEK